MRTIDFKFILLSLLLPLSSYNQILFEDYSQIFNQDYTSSFCVGFSDVNGDYQDDLLLLTQGTDLHCYLKSGDAFDFKGFPNAFPSEPWTLCTGDLDNDGVSEIVVAGDKKGVYIYSLEPELVLRQYIGDQFFAQASNFVDINNDGWLDLFVCNDLGNNYVFLNDQNGLLVHVENVIDFTTIPTSDKSGNYGSEWIDIDNDGDLDLSIAKCKNGVDDTSDPRRINMLFVNDGNGIFTNKAGQLNADVAWQSWTGSWADYDNDGDLDCYLINHDRHHFILRNNGNGQFSHLENFIGEPMFGASIQSLPADFDNDGDVDVLITGPRDYILWNQGNLLFEKDADPFPTSDIYSASFGDINNDGFLDILASNVINYLNLGSENDDLFVSVPNSNNYFLLALEGRASNHNAIGSQIRIFGDWGVQRRDVKAGESYGVVSTKNVHFGLGNNNLIDSLEIKWPSGQIDRFYNLTVNTKYLAVEGVCINAVQPIVQQGLLECPGDQIELSVLQAGEITWSDGQVGNPITIYKGGIYSATITDGNCRAITDFTEVLGPDNLAPPSILAKNKGKICPGVSIDLTIEEYDIIEWSTGESSSQITVDSPGWYTVSIGLDGCVEMLEDSIEVILVAVDLPEIIGDTIDVPGDVLLWAAGDSIHWYETPWTQDILHIGNSYATYADASRKYFVRSIFKEEITPTIIGKRIEDSLLSYGDDNYNDGLFFKAHKDCIIKSVMVNTDRVGSRLIELRDLQGIVLESKLVTLSEVGEQKLTLGFVLQGNIDYFLTTDANTNLNQLSQISPRFSEELSGNFPFHTDPRISILSSKSGESYPYFFNWEIEEGNVVCESGVVDVPVVVGGISGLAEIQNNQIKVFPNPFQQSISVADKTGEMLNIQILDCRGKLHMQWTHVEQSTCLISDLPQGIYLLQYESASYRGSVRIFKY